MTDRQKHFLKEWYEFSLENPIGRGRVVGLCVVELDTWFGGGIWLKSIRSLELNKGHATRAMQLVRGLADRCGVDVVLMPVPFIIEAGKRPPVKTAQLKAWYRKLGFVPAPQNEMVYHSGRERVNR